MTFLMRTYVKTNSRVMMQPRRMSVKAAIFDMGGVLIPSPGKLFEGWLIRIGFFSKFSISK